ncbi:MAG: hypothetical protein J1F68_04790 [Clostridiales bacterium]|nr:hypothetical protein [Clostridiales bacterium]
MGKYKKCPRCELNYILQEEEMCDICKAELGLDSRIVLLDDIIDDDEPLKLCPVCKTSYIGMDEDMCENCLANYKRQESGEMDEDNEDWRTYLDDEDTKDTEEEDVIPLEEMEEDADFDDDFEDEENMDIELDDYPDDLTDDFDDVDFDDDFDDDDEEEDEDDDF